jgi:S-formylglutathione hydrolase FrmB
MAVRRPSRLTAAAGATPTGIEAHTVLNPWRVRSEMPISVPIGSSGEKVFPEPLGGSVENHRFESTVLAGNPWRDPIVRDLPVYLPPSGRTEGRPLLVLLTGYTGAGWMHFSPPTFLRSTIVRRLDHLIRSGAAPEAVLVAPDALTSLGGSQYLNSTATGRYEDYVVEEILPFVQRKYGTGPSALLGTSSGGYGALVLALRHPELFPAAASNAGDAYFEYNYLPAFPLAFRALRRAGGPQPLLERMLSEPTSNFAPSNPEVEAFELMAYASCYSPTVDRPGEFDLPFDLTTGELRPDVWERWLAWDPVRMVRTPRYAAALRRLAYVYVDGGTRDEFALDVGARIFAAAARAQGGRVDHEEFDGIHRDSVPRYDVMIPRLLRALASPDRGGASASV